MQICVATDKDRPQFVADLQSRHAVECVAVSERSSNPPGIDALIVNADLRDAQNVASIRKIAVGAINARKRLFIVGKKSHSAIVQAFSLGATDVLAEPVSVHELIRLIEAQIYFDGEEYKTNDGAVQSVIDTAKHFASLFAAASGEKTLSFNDAQDATNQVYSAINRHGLKEWLDNVRLHHTGTFQHCLLVAGCAVDFGRSLGFSRNDIQRLGLMATLHDIGKAHIPVAILDKPGKLDAVERKMMDSHPMLGTQILSGIDGITAEILDGVRHHHEYLDGSGYPDRLRDAQVSDLVRILTISDIFAALIENRGYKPPMQRNDAYDILRSMHGKLEQPLVSAFRRVALER